MKHKNYCYICKEDIETGREITIKDPNKYLIICRTCRDTFSVPDEKENNLKKLLSIRGVFDA